MILTALFVSVCCSPSPCSGGVHFFLHYSTFYKSNCNALNIFFLSKYLFLHSIQYIFFQPLILSALFQSVYACSFCVAVFCVLWCVRVCECVCECFHFVLQWNVASTSRYCIRYSMWEGEWDLTQPVHHAHVCCMELQVKHF